jgi:hypothetical protein
MTGTPLSFGCEPVVLAYEPELNMVTMPTTRTMFYATLVSQTETERHFLLECAAFAHERDVFWTHLEGTLGAMEYADVDFLDPRLTLLHASPDERLQ